MKPGLRQFRVIAGLMIASLLVAMPSVASRDEEKARTFVESVAAMVYGCAWPTATFESVSYRMTEPVDNGYDAVFRLSGKSGLDDSDLWVDIAFEFRGGNFSDMRVVRHNAFWVAPFHTCKAVGEMIAEAMKPSQPGAPGYRTPAASPSQPAVQRLAAVCINNTADFAMNYAFRWGMGKWEQGSISARGSMRHWWSYDNSPSFQVSFDDSLEDGVTPKERTLSLSSSSDPVSCPNVKNYSFVVQDRSIGLASDSWQPGWQHPFSPSVISATENGKWNPATGYRWFDPTNMTSLDVVPENLGIVGMRISRTKDNLYPMVVGLVRGGPAERAGVHPDMDLIRIDGLDTAPMTLDHCVALLTGQRGTLLRIEVREKGTSERQVFQLVRE